MEDVAHPKPCNFIVIFAFLMYRIVYLTKHNSIEQIDEFDFASSEKRVFSNLEQHSFFNAFDILHFGFMLQI